MNSTLLSYSSDSRFIIQASENGAIYIHTVHPEDGAYNELVFEYNRHKEEVILLDFISDTTFISIDKTGDVSLVNHKTGKEVTAQFNKDLKTALSPDKKVLFIFEKGEKKERHIRKYDTTTLKEMAVITTSSGKFYLPYTKLTGISSDSCLLHHLFMEKLGKPLVENIGIADFSKNTLEIKHFEITTTADIPSHRYPFAIHPESGTGARLDYNQPAEIIGQAFTIRAELFDIYTLETKSYITLCHLTQEADILADLKKHKQYSHQYRVALDKVYRAVVALSFSPDGKTLWTSYKLGAINATSLETGKYSRFMTNEGGTQEGVPTIESISGISIFNNQILHISPDQQFVVFSFPNCFFPFKLPFQEGERIHKVVPRQLSGGEGVTEVPDFSGLTRDGKYLVLAHRAGYMYIINAHTGKQEYYLAEPDITDVAGVDHSDGVISVAVSGANAYQLTLKGNDTVDFMELIIPPHTLVTQYIEPGKAVYIHHDGAVVLCTEASISMDVHFMDQTLTLSASDLETEDIEEGSGDDDEYGEEELDENGGSAEDEDEMEEEDDEDDDDDEEYERDPNDPYSYFDQNIPTFDGTVFRHKGDWQAATINEDGDIHVYSIGNEVKFRYCAPSGESYSYKSICANSAYLIASNYSPYKKQGYVLFKILKNSLKKIEQVKDKDLRFIHLKEEANAILKFNQKTGAFTQTGIPGNKTEILFTYNGPAISGIQYNEATNRLLFIEGSGRLHLLNLKKKCVEFSWELKAQKDKKEVKNIAPDNGRFSF